MKLSFALLPLLAMVYAAPAPQGNDVQPLIDQASNNLQILGAETASGETIPLIVLKGSIFDPTTGDTVSMEDIERAAAENGYKDDDAEKRTLGLLSGLKSKLMGAFGGGRFKFGGGTIKNVDKNYNWNDFLPTLQGHGVDIGHGSSGSDGCNTCMTFNKGGASLGGFNIKNGYRVPAHKSWFGGCDAGCA